MIANHRTWMIVALVATQLLLACRAAEAPAKVKRELAKLQGVWLRGGGSVGH